MYTVYAMFRIRINSQFGRIRMLKHWSYVSLAFGTIKVIMLLKAADLCLIFRLTFSLS